MKKGWIGTGLLAIVLGGVSLTASLTSQTQTVEGAGLFTDVEGHWSESAIHIAVGRGYVDGYEDKTFKPDQQVTRAEFAKMAITALNIPVSGATSGSNWYLPYVNAAVNAGIHKWSDLNTGDWNTPMSRFEMSRMAARAVGKDTVDDKEWMFLATKAGLIQGMDEKGALVPDGNTTRAQAITIIERILTLKSGGALPADKHATSLAEFMWHKTNIETMLDGEYINVANTREENRFNPNILSAEADGGNLKGWVEGLYAIDLDDPNDPYRWLLGGGGFVIYWNGTEAINIAAPVKGGYALVSVNHYEMKKNVYSMNYTPAPEIVVSTEFDYGNTIPVVNGLALTWTYLNFNNDDGSRMYANAIPLSKISGSYNAITKLGVILPKLSGKPTTDNMFRLGFMQFSDFGQKPMVLAKYELSQNRK